MVERSSSQQGVRSMTGFTRVASGAHGIELEVEIKSVNHRFLDVTWKTPRMYSEYERDARAIVQKLHRRGRIDISVTRTVTSTGDDTALSTEPMLSPAFLRNVALYAHACRVFGVGNEGLPGFLGELVMREGGHPVQDVLSDGEVELLLTTVDRASEALAVMREREGAFLAADVEKRLQTVESFRLKIAEHAAVVPQRVRERLEGRIKQLVEGFSLDQGRLLQEVALLAERADISEELSRLVSHQEQFRSALAGHVDGIGRKLDFLTQELMRECNTIGSKAQDAVIQGIVVEAKAEVEKIREQVQNIE
jgi:uncharacterized protein (TIGR00255 family)